MIKELKCRNITVLEVYACLHHWDENCECRKPRAGLFNNIAKDYRLRMDKTLYIGDDVRDCEAAYNAECGSVLISNSKEFKRVKNKPKWIINVSRLSDANSSIKLFMKGINK
jgi:D-glycero-D-manno-heptose 1,7-bisphosphate phosphatase